MALNASPIPKATNAETDFKSPASEDLIQRKFRDSLNMLEDLILSNGLGILGGMVDANPPNTTPSYFTDIDPTVGRISFTDKFIDLKVQFLTGAAAGKKFIVTATDATLKRVHVAENLFFEGVLAGDTYQVLGHDHDNVNSLNVTNITENLRIVSGRTALTNTASGTFETIPFGYTFDEEPVVICTAEESPAIGANFNYTIKNVTKTGFDVSWATGTPRPDAEVMWVAMPQGEYLIQEAGATSDLHIVASYMREAATTGDPVREYLFKKPYKTEYVILGVNHILGNRTATTPRTNNFVSDRIPSFDSAAGSFPSQGSSGFVVVPGQTVDTGWTSFIAISKTTPDATASTTGVEGLFGVALPFNTGMFRNVANPVLTFSGTFAAPVVLLGHEETVATNTSEDKVVALSTTAATLDITGTGANDIVSYLAMPSGNLNILAKRL